MGLTNSCNNGPDPSQDQLFSQEATMAEASSHCSFGPCFCSESSVEAGGDVFSMMGNADCTNKPKHLVINMDINKTVIMSDKVSGKTARDVVNEALSNVVWGKDVNGQWTLRNLTPSSTKPISENPGEELVSYTEWLEKTLPGSKNKKERHKKMHQLTDDGQPGVALAGYTEKAIDTLKHPDGSDMGIVPSFFDMLVALKRQKRTFTLCFRTFGEDLAAVADEFNMFCEGRHILYPDFRMDGSDEEPDYRFYVSDPDACGTFHRVDECTSLVMGTIEQAGEGRFKDETDKSLKFYDLFNNVKIISGMFEVQQYLKKRYQKSGTFALRDYFQFWKKKDMQTEGGKPFFYDARHANKRHELFFDDNICYSSCQIVQPINLPIRSHHGWPVPLLQTHLVRVEPWDAIYDRNYFISNLARLELGYKKKLATRKRLQDLLWRIMHRLHDQPRLRKNNQKLGEYDAWRNLRQHSSQFSRTSLHGNYDEDDARKF